jgi:hypothetical protein
MAAGRNDDLWEIVTMSKNVLQYLPANENAVTTLLRALCVLKPIREIVARLFTGGSFGADDIPFEGIATQFGIGGPILDMCLRGDALCVTAEVKVGPWQALTANQPNEYLAWLAKQNVPDRFFVFLVPPRYQHYGEYKNRKAAFLAANPGHNIHFIEINWLDLSSKLRNTGLSSVSVYARDFQSLIEQLFAPKPIQFTHAELEVTDMFNAVAAGAVCKTFDFVKQMALELEMEGQMSVERLLYANWWNEGEYAICLKCGGQYVLYLGIWIPFWSERGFPLCIGVANIWAPDIIHLFQEAFPDAVLFPPHGNNQYWVTGIPRHHLIGENAHLIGENAVEDVLHWLRDSYLNNVCAQINGNQPPADN